MWKKSASNGYVDISSCNGKDFVRGCFDEDIYMAIDHDLTKDSIEDERQVDNWKEATSVAEGIGINKNQSPISGPWS